MGNTGLRVSVLGFGTLTMSPLQRGMHPDEGAELIVKAVEAGVNFIDTAQMYGSYAHVSAALRKIAPDAAVIASKSVAKTRRMMIDAVEEASDKLSRKTIDIFLMHAIRDVKDFEERLPALEALKEQKARGRIRAVGASTHSYFALKRLIEDPDIEILHPIFNISGIGMIDSGLQEMTEALGKARKSGKGIYAMKPLGGGHLRSNAAAALKWIFRHPMIDSAVVGMTSENEISMNAALARGDSVDEDEIDAALRQPRKLFINRSLCRLCGKCIETCHQSALKICDGKVEINHDLCLLCGYCVKSCPTFSIRVI